VQLLGDHYGNLVHLYERECSLQRRYQKIIEEAPSPTLTPELRRAMGEAAVNLGKAIDYTNAGTIEFLLDQDQQFYFLEMNTRVQVEHPVTELTTRIDIVAEQIRIAAGEPLSFQQDDVPQWGHAIECRVYAEAPEENFRPSPGTITYHHPPSSGAVRLDTAVVTGSEIDPRYDPMIGKLIAYGTDRERARQHAITALKNYAIHGIDTNLTYLIALLSTDDFRDNRISTHYCDEHTPQIIERMMDQKAAIDQLPVVLAGLLHSLTAQAAAPLSVWQEIGFWRLVPALEVTLDDDASVAVELREIAPGRYRATHGDQEHTVQLMAQQEGRVDFRLDDDLHTAYVSETEEGAFMVTLAGFNFRLRRNDLPNKKRLVGSVELDSDSDDTVVSPMPGKVIALPVQAGDTVQRGDTLLVVEAMKMENTLTAPRDGVVQEVRVALDDRIERNVPLILLEAPSHR
jgi:acetyl/propionyl-CoA carboxylase alpha subunit